MPRRQDAMDSILYEYLIIRYVIIYVQLKYVLLDTYILNTSIVDINMLCSIDLSGYVYTYVYS